MEIFLFNSANNKLVQDTFMCFNGDNSSPYQLYLIVLMIYNQSVGLS